MQPPHITPDPTMSLSAHVTTASGQKIAVPEGSQLVFGRGPDVDLVIPAGRGLSRRAGVVTPMPAGVWIANISRTHALYVEGDGYRIRLPRMEDDGEPPDGWFVHLGSVYFGSRAMLDDGQPLAVTVTGKYDGIPIARGAALPDAAEWVDSEQQERLDWIDAESRARARLSQRTARHAMADPLTTASLAQVPPDAEGTLLPLYLDPMTKLFLVALIWCYPWLVDPSATRPLPRTPEIARGALEVTGAYHELERFDADPVFRDLLSARVAEHIKVLRRKITDRGLAPADVRLSDEVAVRILIDHGIITSADLGRLDDPVWRSRQEDLWWTQG
jgi:hypothetical protein